MLTCLVPVLFKFYIQGVLKLKKNNSGVRRVKVRKSKIFMTNVIMITLTNFYFTEFAFFFRTFVYKYVLKASSKLREFIGFFLEV